WYLAAKIIQLRYRRIAGQIPAHLIFEDQAERGIEAPVIVPVAMAIQFARVHRRREEKDVAASDRAFEQGRMACVIGVCGQRYGVLAGRLDDPEGVDARPRLRFAEVRI